MVSKIPGADGLVGFPDIIETAEEGPVLLAGLLRLPAVSCEASDGLQIVKIDGCSAHSPALAELPGIRVGDGPGSGYVFRRTLDGELVYAPDAGYTGLTSFTCTIADIRGVAVTLLATVSVHSSLERHVGNISFADGSHRVTVPEGIDAAILGALAVDGVISGEALEFRVFEGEAAAPSNRFVVESDKLRVVTPLVETSDGTIQLKVFAYDAGEQAIAASTLLVDILQARSSGAANPGATPDWPKRMAAINLLDELKQMDQFHFSPVRGSSSSAVSPEALEDEEHLQRAAMETSASESSKSSGAAAAPPSGDIALPEDPAMTVVPDNLLGL